MSERKFSKGLGKPGMAAQVRETVSQVVRESTVHTKPQLVEPIDFESYILKNKTLLQNDTHRELLLYPADDVSQVVLPRRHRTLVPTSSSTSAGDSDGDACNLFTRMCIQSYTSNWNLIHYKYNAYSSTFLELPLKANNRLEEHAQDVYEIDTDVDKTDADIDETTGCSKDTTRITKQGYLMKGPDIGGSDRMFPNIGSKSFKKRYCYLRQEVDGTYILELYKDEKKGDAKVTIVMDFCTDLVTNVKKGRFCFELRMTAGHKSYSLAADNETEYKDWTNKLSSVLQQNKIQEEKRAASLERSTTSTPPPCVRYGTLKSLEQSMNPQLMKYARETELSIAHARRNTAIRRKLFHIYYPIASQLKLIKSESTVAVEPYKEQFGQRIFIRCDSIKFKLQIPDIIDDNTTAKYHQIEPYFTTLCLFDVRNQKKLSENFYFDVNDANGRSMLNTQNGGGDDHITQCILNITNPHSDIYLVIRIDKILQGNVYQTTEPYMKCPKDVKQLLKLHKTIRLYCARQRLYRQPFAWGVRPLFKLYSTQLDSIESIDTLYRQDVNRTLTDEDMLKILAEYRKTDKINKLYTIIPGGTLKIHLEHITDSIENTLTSSMQAIKPFGTGPRTLEINEFQNTNHPYTTYINHLYVYPEHLAYDTQKVFPRARNILCCVELYDTDTISDARRPLDCFYRQYVSNKAHCTAVLHHNTTPSWCDEIKIELPMRIAPGHHLLFTFYHVSCDINKKVPTVQGDVESCIGYAWTPLLTKGKLNLERQVLPVATHLPSGYLSIQPLGLGKGNAGPDIQWIDNQKAIFTIAFNLISSVNTTDQHLYNLFVHTDNELCKILKALHAIQLHTLTKFLPTIFNHLFTMLCAVKITATPSDEIGINIIRVMINLIHMLHEGGHGDLLKSYIKYVFIIPTSSTSKCVHIELVKHLATILHPNNTDFLVVHKFMEHSTFFFDVIIKSMAQYLLTTERIKMHRNERFSKEYLEKIETLLDVLVAYITTKYKEMPTETFELNKSLANFIKKCLSFMDRGHVFKLINLYIDKINNYESTSATTNNNINTSRSTRTLCEYKFKLLQIVCSHEHYIIFNLPIKQQQSNNNRSGANQTSPKSINEYTLSDQYCKHHYLVALLLQEIRAVLSNGLQLTTRKVAVQILRDLLAKHEQDDRYQSRGQMNRIAMLYVPWLNIVIENSHRIETDCSGVLAGDNTGSTTNRYTLHLDQHTVSSTASPIHMRDSTYFAAIAGQALLNGNSSMSLNSDVCSTTTGDVDDVSTVSQDTVRMNNDTTSELDGDAVVAHHQDGSSTFVRHNQYPNRSQYHHARSISIVSANNRRRVDKLQRTEIKDILICVLFVLKYIGDEHQLQWYQQCTELDLYHFFALLEKCLHCFKYLGKHLPTSEDDKITLTSSATTNKLLKAHTLPARMNPPGYDQPSAGNSSTLTGRENLVAQTTKSVEEEVHLNGNLATECGMIVLDCIGLYSMHFTKKLLEEDDSLLMHKIFDIYLIYLEIGASELLLQHVFASLRAHINLYASVLFKGNATLCGKLCYQLLRCCNSRISTIRQEACAILYLLMRSNYDDQKCLTRVHLQLIISVSQMLGNNNVSGGLNNARFQESLSLINSYASSDKAVMNCNFPNEVKDLTKRIRTVLMATLQMREHHSDPEMLVDLQHSLANSYASTPELRRTWLETMTRNHIRDGNVSEAACCQLHIAALMAEYLKLKHQNDLFGAEQFNKISSNIKRDECGLKLDAGVQDIQYNEYILLEQLERCVEYLERAERYELLGELYRLIVPFYERNHQFNQLAHAYQNLSKAYTKIVEVMKSGKRLLGRFYRVAFYGPAYFEDDSGVEYIYKEPKVTTLSEISERLQNQFSLKYGGDVIKMIMDSVPVKVNELDSKFAYIQVTHVIPYHLDNTAVVGAAQRLTEFEQNHDISCFMYETPFCKDGRARGAPEEQWKRRTILTTQYSFPYVKKRIVVNDRRIEELSPIEVAIDEMSQRVSELEDVVFTEPTDIKKLQLRLQGSVCVQVNAGPLAYASVFLDPTLSNLYPDDKVDELKDIFRDFLKICYTALQINSKLITSDQCEYQEALRHNYKKLCVSLSTLFGEALWPHDDTGSFKRNSLALFSAISGASYNSSTA